MANIGCVVAVLVYLCGVVRQLKPSVGKLKSKRVLVVVVEGRGREQREAEIYARSSGRADAEDQIPRHNA